MIAGGGTGGHLFPALAIAEAFMERKPDRRILFVGTGRGLEASVLAKEKYSYQTITVASWHGKSPLAKLGTLFSIPRSLWRARSLIHSFHPDFVLGVGGYASGPVVLVAWASGVRTAIQEQNAFPGLSNRILGRFVDRVFISFADSARHFPAKKTVLTGNPVRRKMRPKTHRPPGEGTPPFTLLVFGGSQGAHRLNQAMVESLPYLRAERGKWRIIHQCGDRDIQEVREGYAKEGWEAEVQAFIHEMDQAYGAADLVVCRAGATTLFELMAMGKPAVLVPYPFAANDHQALNARVLVRAGAALMIRNEELTGSLLGGTLRELSGDPGRLESMGRASAALAKPQAAQEIVNRCVEMMSHE